MKAYSYVLVYDAGFAPNPFGGCCTLATCKPQIRRRARVGDWILGCGSTRNVGHGKLIHAMHVSEVLSIKDYGESETFASKIPTIPGTPDRECGDNIYFRDDGGWRQRLGLHGPNSMERDLGGENVLIAEIFYYFGANAIDVPERFQSLICKGRGDRCKFDEQLVQSFVHWIEREFPKGLRGLPCAFAEHETPSSELPAAKCEPTSRKSKC